MSGVEAYLADLERRLRRSRPKEVADSRLREVRAHLEEAARIEGEAAALRCFGGPAANARAIVRQARGYVSRSAASLSWTVGLALATAFSASAVWSERAMTPMALQTSVWAPFLAALLFARRCLQTRRWLALPVAAWGALGIVSIFAILAIAPARVDAKDARASVASARENLAIWDRNAREATAWRAGVAPADSEPYVWRSPTTSFIAGLPFEIHSMSEPLYDLSRYDGPHPPVRAAWVAYGEAWAREVVVRRKEAVEYLAAQEAGLAYAPRPLGEQARACLWGVAQIAAVLLAFNALALALGRLADTAARPARRVRR